MAALAASPPVDIGFTCTNEELFVGFQKLTSGSPLPSNIIDENPYRYEPQHLPDDFWFLTSSKENIDMEHGFWMIKEEARDVFSNSDIIGWRTTLEYYKGKKPYEHKTNWLMQVFSITQKRSCDDNEKKETSSLCRVFLVPSDEMQQKVSSARNDTENHLPQPPVLDANSSTRIGSSRNPQAVAERYPVPEHQGENNVEMDFFTGGPNDFFSGGNFLELNDFDNPVSSSSSENSSAASVSSDECFDSMAFLQELDQDQVVERNDAGRKLNVSNRLDEVVIVPATTGSLVSIDGSNSGSDEFFKTSSSVPNSASGSRGLNNNVTKHAKGYQRGEGPSSSRKPSTSTDSHTAAEAAAAGGRKRDAFGRMKKLRKKYFCFMPF